MRRPEAIAISVAKKKDCDVFVLDVWKWLEGVGKSASHIGVVFIVFYTYYMFVKWLGSR